MIASFQQSSVHITALQKRVSLSVKQSEALSQDFSAPGHLGYNHRLLWGCPSTHQMLGALPICLWQSKTSLQVQNHPQLRTTSVGFGNCIKIFTFIYLCECLVGKSFVVWDCPLPGRGTYQSRKCQSCPLLNYCNNQFHCMEIQDAPLGDGGPQVYV